MTGANVFHWTAGAGRAANTNAAGPKTKTKTEDPSIAGMFAFMMSAGNTGMPDQAKAQKPLGDAEIRTPAEAFDRYQYRDAEIGRANAQGIGEKITESEDLLGDFREQVITEVAEELEVSEEDVLQAMELLGLTAYDLMNPANLAQLAFALTGAENPSELLMRPEFMDLMKRVKELGDGLMTAMKLEPDQKNELIAHMDVLEQPEALEEMPELLGAQETQEQPQEAQAPQPEMLTQKPPEMQAIPQQQAKEVQEQPQGLQSVQVQVDEQPGEPVLQNQAEAETLPANEPAAETEGSVKAEVEPETAAEANPKVLDSAGAEVQEAAAKQPVQPETVQAQAEVQNAGEPQAKQEAVQPAEQLEAPEEETPEYRLTADEPQQQSQNEQPADRKEPGNGWAGGGARKEAGSVKHPFEGAEHAALVSGQEFRLAADMPVRESSYVSFDTIDIIRQIAEQVKVNISGETTSMEMQLNPENLGKVYVQVSAREGTVNAQITAANEAVRNALEAQVADLKQTLNQAGVKVDAIEVTVASHEFEQNLEQNARQEEQEGERAAAAAVRRRSIRLDDLDGLLGVMTEEETLAAQIMRDNGNTVDLSA